ncbi:IS30 family transposase, partial [Flavicella sp.]|uniref:IS30 family transposase n=1 Tax=Flavicella sp. TaxID=2957742 RepID=UPI0030195925
DLVIGKNHKSAIGTIVERKTRAVLIIKLKSKKAEEVAKEFSKILNNLNPIFKKTMTYDNGIEMARHEKTTKNTTMKIFFAHPYILPGKEEPMKTPMDSLEDTFLKEPILMK